MVKDRRRKSQSLSRIWIGPNFSTSLMRPLTQIPLSLPPPPHHQLGIFHPGNSAFNVILRIHQAASAIKPGETLNPEILRAESEVVFLCSQHVPFKFPVGSHQVPNMLPRFPKGVPNSTSFSSRMFCTKSSPYSVSYQLIGAFPLAA
jgi:hypothetical protein